MNVSICKYRRVKLTTILYDVFEVFEVLKYYKYIIKLRSCKTWRMIYIRLLFT